MDREGHTRNSLGTLMPLRVRSPPAGQGHRYHQAVGQRALRVRWSQRGIWWTVRATRQAPGHGLRGQLLSQSAVPGRFRAASAARTFNADEANSNFGRSIRSDLAQTQNDFGYSLADGIVHIIL